MSYPTVVNRALTLDQVRTIRARAQRGDQISQRQLAREYGVTWPVISRIIAGRTYTEPEAFPAPLPIAPPVVRERSEKPVPSTAVDAIAIFRREKELAQLRNAPRKAQLDAEVKASWKKALADQLAAQKGGRPRKITLNLPSRDRDLRPRAG